MFIVNLIDCIIISISFFTNDDNLAEVLDTIDSNLLYLYIAEFAIKLIGTNYFSTLRVGF
jgi:hypothetical protein